MVNQLQRNLSREDGENYISDFSRYINNYLGNITQLYNSSAPNNHSQARQQNELDWNNNNFGNITE